MAPAPASARCRKQSSCFQLVPDWPARAAAWDKAVDAVLVQGIINLVLEERGTRLLNHSVEGVKK